MGCPKSLYMSKDMKNKVIVNVLVYLFWKCIFEQRIGSKELILLYFYWTTHSKTGAWLKIDFF